MPVIGRNFWVGLACLSVMGCFGSSSAATKHADFHHCSSSDVKTEEIQVDGRSAFKTIGCGKEEVFFCIGAKCRSPRILAVRKFAASESCPEASLTTAAQGADGWTVSGCSKSITYRCREVPDEVVDCQPSP